jgi:hypothetical protein
MCSRAVTCCPIRVSLLVTVWLTIVDANTLLPTSSRHEHQAAHNQMVIHGLVVRYIGTCHLPIHEIYREDVHNETI